MSSAGGRPSRQKMVSVRTSIVPPGPRPLPADTPDASTATTTPQVTASLHDFAVSLADIPGVGEHGAQPGADAGVGQLLAAGLEHRVQQGAVHRVLGQHRTDDDLLRGDHELAVVPGHITLLVAHHPHVRVGDIRPRLGVVAVGARFVQGPPGRPSIWPIQPPRPKPSWPSGSWTTPSSETLMLITIFPMAGSPCWLVLPAAPPWAASIVRVRVLGIRASGWRRPAPARRPARTC